MEELSSGPFVPVPNCIAAALVALLVATLDGFLPTDALAWLPDVDRATVQELLKLLAGVLKDLAESAAPGYLKDIVAEAKRAEAFGAAKLLLDADRQALARLVDDARKSAAGRTS